MSGNLLHALYAERKPASAALCFADGSVLSTGELVKHVALVATALHELGIRPGDRVSFKLEKSAEVLFLVHACLQLGAIFNPLNTS
jgi:malonyl-CoA/methylmalonyl-CoA synthetase